MLVKFTGLKFVLLLYTRKMVGRRPNSGSLCYVLHNSAHEYEQRLNLTNDRRVIPY